ncbi:hypothetical protein TRL7639_04476 [Falsiruegeria litorea R37]|uniref:Ig-like domain-containing protein n=1 Tax=Falsiruegeria litorea R37 TaxID=1200284 RepID=A0A1Y5TYY0_9RHOB|nr:Ig-like domain-containing protein [Falsiruegeria litorea]SLN73976.1 hypothetical protein TRL7639_04476 [Falsiruegeria litorea R37]
MKTPISTQDQRAADQQDDGARRHFIRKWLDRKWQAFAKTGLGGLLLALPALAQASTPDDAYLDVDTMANVRSVQTLGDGSVQLTLLDGRQVIVQAADVRILDADQILISGEAAAEIAQLAADTAGGGDGGGGGASGLGGAGAALAGLGVAGAVGGGGGGGGGAAPAPPPLTLSDLTSTGLSNASTGTTVPAGTENVVVTIGSFSKTVTPDEDGNWTLTLTQAEAAALPQGATTIEVAYENAAGNIFGTETVAYTIDTQPPSLTINPVAGDAIVNAAEAGSDLNITGTTDAEDGQTVTVTLNGQTYTGTASGGAWSVTVPAAALTALGDGANMTVTADVTDAAGNPAAQASSALSTDFTAPTVTMNAVADGTINLIDQGRDLQITGTTTAADGDPVVVSFNGQNYGGAANGGTWGVTIPQADLAGLTTGTDIAVSVTVTDAAGNTSTAVTASVPVDLTGPSLTLADLPFGTALSAAEAGADVTVSGTTNNVPDGQAVTVTLNGQTYTGAVSGGNWSVTIPAADLGALTNSGAYTLTADVSDTDGIAAPQVSSGFLADFTAPTLTITSLSSGAVMNAAEAGTDLTVSGTTDAEDGQTVTVTLNSQTYTGTVSGGSWSVTVPAASLSALTDGATIPLTADVSDVAGNAATQASSSFDTDFTAYTVTLTALSDGAVMNAAEQGTDLTMTGGSDAPDGTQVTVSLVRSDGTVDASGTATVTGGAWSLTIPAASLAALQDGQTYTAKADVADDAGNVGSATSSFATDFTAPTLTLNALSVGGVLDAIERKSDLAVSGSTTAEDGQTVTVTLNGQTYAATASGGAWSVTIPQADLATLADTTDYALSANVSDAAGNAATQASAGLSTDFRPILTLNDVGSNDAVVLSTAKASGLTVSGSSAELAAGQSVDVTLNGTLVGSATVASNGSWSLAIPASSFSAITAGTNLSFEANASVAGGRDPLPATDTAVAYDAGAYVIAETGRDGSTVTFAMYADPDRDVSGGLAVTSQMTFDSSVVAFDAGSVNANNAFSLFLANPADASTVNFAGAATSFGDLSSPLVTFEMTVQDASKPIVLKLTTPDGGPTTLQFGTDGADTLVAEDVSNVIQGGGGNDSIDVSEGGRHVVVFEADPSANGTDTVTGFTLGPEAQITDAITFSGLDMSSLRGAGTGVENLASGATIGTDTGVVGFTTAVSDLNADTLADAAETLVGTDAGDVFYFMASDGSNAAMARVTFSDADTATAEVMGTFNGLSDLSTLHADNILHTDPTGAAA